MVHNAMRPKRSPNLRIPLVSAFLPSVAKLAVATIFALAPMAAFNAAMAYWM
ncbi:hypothetical protein D3C76_1503150 [compost metagenome]